MSHIVPWSKKDCIEIILGYTAMIGFISWVFYGIVKFYGYIGLTVPLAVSTIIGIFIWRIFKNQPLEDIKTKNESEEEQFDYTKMGANQ